MRRRLDNRCAAGGATDAIRHASLGGTYPKGGDGFIYATGSDVERFAGPVARLEHNII